MFFSAYDIPEMINLQEVRGETKPYQIREFVLESLSDTTFHWRKSDERLSY